jgi:hypothetical protein
MEVPGWEAVDGRLQTTYPRHGMYRDVEWSDAQPTGDYGCGECQWEGPQDELERLGVDGAPLPVLHPRQMRMDAA